MTRDEEFFVAQVPCPHCESPAEIPCRDFNARFSARSHMKRVRAAAEQGLISKEVVDREQHRRR